MEASSFDDLAKLIREQTSSIKIDLSKQIDNLRLEIGQAFSKQIVEIKDDIKLVQHRQDVLESRVERAERLLHSTDLIAHGIPSTKSENLYDIFHQICAKIDFIPKDFTLQSIFRIKSKSNFSPVILKFISSSAKTEFYMRYIKFKNLNLSDIGFASHDRIYLQESLSTLQAEIFRRALTFKKSQQLFSVFTQNGFVNVKQNSTSGSIRLVSLSQLDDLVQQDVEVDVDAQSSNKRKITNSPGQSSSPKSNEAKLFKQAATFATSSTAATTQLSKITEPAADKAAPSKNTKALTTALSQRSRSSSIGTLDNFVLVGK